MLGGVTRKTQNTFDLLAERCHGASGAKVKTTCSSSSSESPGSAIQAKTNYVLDLKSPPQSKSVSIAQEQGSVSETLVRKSSLKIRGGAAKLEEQKRKVGKESRIESGRQLTDADLASAVAVATAAAGDTHFLAFSGL